MSSRAEKERFKATQEKAQAILASLLKDEDNKYCVDCDAKGPRWASWNLGIFLCIRCAGIHRNLGVHITKVKSVNLDTWTPEQISMMMEIGNSRARAVYEANIPDNFRRPQTDSPLESFIRAKYEHKKYIAREWIPPTPKVPREFQEDDSKDKKRNKPKAGMIQLNATPKPKPSSAATNGDVRRSPDAPKPPKQEVPVPTPPKESGAAMDLLGLDTPTHSSSSNADLLGDLLGGAQPAQPAQSAAVNNTATTQQVPDAPPGQTTPDQQVANGTSAGEESLMSETQSKSTKESILALYGSSSNQQQQFGVPGGVYMTQQPGQQQMGMYGGIPMMGMAQQPGMMAQQPGMMAQQPGMMAQQQPGMMPQQPGMMAQQPGIMAQQQGMMAQQQGMMGAQANMYGMGGQQMMMQGAPANMGMTGNMGPMGMYSQPQMQQYQQMQQQMSSLKLGNSAGIGMAAPNSSGMTNWGAPSTLSNNLWQ